MQRKMQVTTSAVPFPNTMVIGLDLGDRWSRYCMLDNAGAVLEENRVRSTDQALEERFRTLSPTRFVIETGTHSPWVSRLLTAMGHSVLVANWATACCTSRAGNSGSAIASGCRRASASSSIARTIAIPALGCGVRAAVRASIRHHPATLSIEARPQSETSSMRSQRESAPASMSNSHGRCKCLPLRIAQAGLNRPERERVSQSRSSHPRWRLRKAGQADRR